MKGTSVSHSSFGEMYRLPHQNILLPVEVIFALQLAACTGHLVLTLRCWSLRLTDLDSYRQIKAQRSWPSEFQHLGISLKGTSGIQGETEVSGIKARTAGQLSQTERWAEAIFPL